MKKIYFLVLLLFVVGTASAQELLSKEEKARREKNVEAGNPFKKFGYKAKVATLSKGKYLEVHDLDSIVVIGSVRFHVDKKEIVGFVEPDCINGMYARPIGDMPSRWLSPDPLAEEFTSWSPYNMCFDNPLRFVDPDGMQADDIIIRGKNVTTGEMQPAIVVKTDLINVTVDNENIPVFNTHDPITNKENPVSPVVIAGVDSQIKTLENTLGKADAISVSLSGSFVAGGGISGGANMTAFLTGKDAGGVFGYSTDGPSPTIGLSVGVGVEVGAVFASSATQSSFDRTTLTGYSVNLAGGNGTVSMGVKGMFDWTPTSYSMSVGTGFSGFKAGASASMTNTVLQSVFKNPKK